MQRFSHKEMVAMQSFERCTLRKPPIKTNRIPQLETNMKQRVSVIIKACSI